MIKHRIVANKVMAYRRFPINGKFSRIFLLLLLGCGLYYFVSNWTVQKDHTWTSFAVANMDDNSSGLILDTPACKIPNLDPYDSSVAQLIKKLPPLKCRGKLLLSTARNNVVIFNEDVLKNYYHTKLEHVSCTYQPIIRQYEPENTTSHREVYITLGEKKKLPFGTPLAEELIIAKCQIGGTNLTQFIPLAPLKFEKEKKEAEKKAYSENELNILLFHIDSMSRLNFLRQFPKTRSFLEDTLGVFDMKGYTKVGDNTFPNLIPLLTGHFVEYYWNETLRNTMYFDDVDLIWNHYSEKGYRTFYAEDSPYFGTFTYGKRGFREPPTDYYYRPMALAVEESKIRDVYCIGPEPDIHIIYHHLRNFVQTMQNRPFFAFPVVSTMTHDDLNIARYADEPTFNILQELWEMGTFNKTALIIYGDHGLRFGKIRETYIGKFEERLPFMYLYFPPWYLERYPHYAKNLAINQNRLITLFDVHATLLHLLNKPKGWTKTPKKVKNDEEPRGLSLFNEISPHRTCDQADILPHWCACQIYQLVSPNDDKAIKSAMAVIDNINYQLEQFKEYCAVLKLKKIEDARFGQANDIVLRFVKHQNDVIDRKVVTGKRMDAMRDYLITFVTTPGDGMFEGTIRYYVTEKKFVVLGVSRINLYGKQSQCIESQELRKYCFCK